MCISQGKSSIAAGCRTLALKEQGGSLCRKSEWLLSHVLKKCIKTGLCACCYCITRYVFNSIFSMRLDLFDVWMASKGKTLNQVRLICENLM